MESHIKISVILPIYNVEPYLSECLAGVMSQSLKDIEIICVDDGSTDGSPDILKALASRDQRLKILRQENQGPGPARNAGIKEARGEYLAFMDPDDLYPDDLVLEHLYHAAVANKADICGGGVKIFRHGSNRKPIVNFFEKDIFTQDGPVTFQEYQYAFSHFRFIFKRNFIIDNNIYYPNYRRGEDGPWFVMALHQAGWFYGLKRISYLYRVGHKPAAQSRQNKLIEIHSELELLEFSEKHHYPELAAQHEVRLVQCGRDLLLSDPAVAWVARHYWASAFRYYWYKFLHKISKGPTGRAAGRKLAELAPKFKLVRSLRLY